MSAATPLLDNTIEPDEPESISGNISNNSTKKQNVRSQVVLTPTTRSSGSNGQAIASNEGDAEAGEFYLFMLLVLSLNLISCNAGIAGIFRQVYQLPNQARTTCG